eukprot:4044486-Amphidinium_carterae.1
MEEHSLHMLKLQLNLCRAVYDKNRFVPNFNIRTGALLSACSGQMPEKSLSPIYSCLSEVMFWKQSAGNVAENLLKLTLRENNFVRNLSPMSGKAPASFLLALRSR